MSSVGRRLLVVPLLLLVAGTTVAAPSATAADGAARSRAGTIEATQVATRVGTLTRPPATMRVAAAQQAKKKKKGSPTQRVQHVTVQWKGTAKKKVYAKTAVVPGIGQLLLTCRPNATFIRLVAEDRSAETQLWMAKYETKNGRAVVATKNARIYRYANADDTGRGGTGASASEGLNQLGNIENFSNGHIDGIISQRPGRNRPVAGTAPTPVTSFQLNWWWTGFRNPMSWRSCKIDVVLLTKFSPRMGVSWHGEDDAATEQYAEFWQPTIGSLQVRCEPDADGVEGRRTIALAPLGGERRSTAWVETVTGEGRVEDHADAVSYGYDTESGRLGSFELPRNGMMRIFFTVGGRKRAYVVSSYQVTNNRARPDLNLCEVAVAEYPVTKG